jgi:hypothetical protein
MLAHAYALALAHSFSTPAHSFSFSFSALALFHAHALAYFITTLARGSTAGTLDNALMESGNNFSSALARLELLLLIFALPLLLLCWGEERKNSVRHESRKRIMITVAPSNGSVASLHSPTWLFYPCPFLYPTRWSLYPFLFQRRFFLCHCGRLVRNDKHCCYSAKICIRRSKCLHCRQDSGLRRTGSGGCRER